MDIYYKYTRYFGIESLKDFSLRISLPLTLNDPFEGVLNSDVEDMICEKISKQNTVFSNLASLMPHDAVSKIIRGNINLLPKLVGVISLSETPRNLTMWAHYANEHNGLCIGLKNDFINKSITRNDFSDNVTIKTPLKVNYDSIRPQSNEDITDIQKEASDQTLKHLITKSKDWIHEQEHRCIISPEQADMVKVLSDKIDMSLFKHLQELNKLTSKDSYTYEGSGFTSLYANYHNEKDVAFLKRINTSSIASIYIGCRLPNADKLELINEVKNPDSKLHHVKLYECTPSKNRYELDIKRIQ
ncbi:TPA: DUF2971 domain-containing protein [Aeromonas hydrophila]|nr:DUF2971 domain-containing protein [Aeromonas hydrophila]